MTERLIKNCRYYQDHRFIKGDLLFRDGKVASDTRAGENASVVDAEGRYLVPGFLDIHTHGGNNIDVNAASPRDIETIASFFASHGTTGFQTSILTDTPEKTLECIGNVAATKKDDYDGAEIIGADAFKECTGLVKVVIPASVKEIGCGAFEGCQSE